MKNTKKEMPFFKSEIEERRFWRSHDSADYLDWSRGTRMEFPNLKPSLRVISLRLPEPMLVELKTLANKRDVPYQSLIKIYLKDRIEREMRG